MGNERLRSALARRALTVDDVASNVGVDPKTVERWLGGRTPHPRHRWAVAAMVGEDESYLWPESVSSQRMLQASSAEVIALYPHRSNVPGELWWALFNRAEKHIDILVYAAVFLHEQYPQLNHLLRDKAKAGCKIRVALGDPECEQVRQRGVEEQFGYGIETRCRVALMHYRPLLQVPGIEINLHQTTLYNSIYRFDDEMIVNMHVWGVDAYSAPALHLRRLDGGSLFSTYQRSFEAVWATSQRVEIEKAYA